MQAKSLQKFMPTTELAGLTILVTRPEHQAEPLCRLIETAGGQPLRLPALTILHTNDDLALSQRLSQLSDYQIAIFISPNAVTYGLDAIERCGGMVDSLLLAAVGKGSAHALHHRLGRKPDLVPQGSFDSEALLALGPLQHISGKRILIFRGVGGREHLADTLRQRRAIVDYAEVYRRATPPSPADGGWLDKTDIITLTSCEAIQNLVTMTPEAARAALFAKPLVVISQRCAEHARQLGFAQAIHISPQASDEAMANTLIEWAQGLHNINGK